MGHSIKEQQAVKPTQVNRRGFLKQAGLGAGLLILPSGVVFGQNAPSNKLNIALIGADGRGREHYNGLKNEHVGAICDVDEDHLAFAAQQFPDAKKYVDWRKCLEQKDLDAVVCCTTDFTHAFVGTWAMNRGLHLYLEKPMGITVEEVRMVRDTYLKNKKKIATQHGTQRHSMENFNRVSELIRDGAVGELQSAIAWGNRKIPRDGYLPEEGKPPKNLHYDLWLGPTPFHPYNPGYFSGKPAANCLQWNMYWDFGVGQIGDMGSHTMDLAWAAIDAGAPLTAEASGDPFNPDVTPVMMKSEFEHPANNWRPAIKVGWYQGGAMPDSPRKYVDLNKIDHGVLFQGSKGALVSSFGDRILIPKGDEADMTYYKPRPQSDLFKPLGNFQEEWFNACKGDLKTTCNLEYASGMLEQLLLGLVAYRVGKKIEYDAKKGRVTNSDEANALLSRKYRKGWVLNG